MESILDNLESRERLDPSGMIAWVGEFMQHCINGSILAQDVEFPPHEGLTNTVICGMGGSAMGGELLRAYAGLYCPIPIEVVRSYELPAYVSRHSLFIASSYSGNTEETLVAYEEAKQRGAYIVGLTTGGELKRLCDEDGYPCVVIQGGLPPRAGLGYSFFAMMKIVERFGLIPEQTDSFRTAYRALNQCAKLNSPEIPTEQNPAKQLAIRLHGKIPVIYAGEPLLAPVALRWRAQINENAKVFAHELSLPEMNHNEILAWKNPSELLRRFHIVYLLDKKYPKVLQQRFEVMRPIIEEAADGASEAWARGSEPLARMASLIHMGDYVSVYLAHLYQEDPVPVPAIDLLKSEMAKRTRRKRLTPALH